MNAEMKKLRAEARTLIEAYAPDCDVDLLIAKLADVGRRMMAASV